MDVRIMVLGVVQGLTEFLPVSSSGHLLLLGPWLGARDGVALAVWLHGGTLVAVVWGYRRDLGRFLRDLIPGRGEARREGLLILVATLPAVGAGLLLDPIVSRVVSPIWVAAGWLATTLLIWRTPPGEAGSQRIADIGLGAAVGVGIFQAFALWPGLSRSGATLYAARRLGLSPAEAARLSFWMAIPTVLGALVLTLVRHPAAPVSLTWAAGFGLAAVSGYFAIKWVQLVLLESRRFQRFGWYTLVAALAAAVWGWWR